MDHNAQSLEAVLLAGSFTSDVLDEKPALLLFGELLDHLDGGAADLADAVTGLADVEEHRSVLGLVGERARHLP